MTLAPTIYDLTLVCNLNVQGKNNGCQRAEIHVSFFSKNLRQWIRGVMCCICLCVVSIRSNGTEHVLYSFNIPVQPLVKSLNELSNQTQTLVLFPYELVEKRKGNAINGEFTLAQAIDELLRNTGLVGGLSKKEVMMISQEQLSLPTKNNNGKNTMNSKKSILATAMAFLFSGTAITTTASAQEAESQAPQESVEKIAILGTRGPRMGFPDWS